MKVHAPSADRNKDPILDVISTVWTKPTHVLEIASGSGQHVVHFAAAMPHVTWHPTDLNPTRVASVSAYVAESKLDNVAAATVLDAAGDQWPERTFGGILAINVIHMVGDDTVKALFERAGAALEAGGKMVIYECCTYQGAHVSPSNARFDEWLKETTEAGHVYEYDDLVRWAAGASLFGPEIHHLPANNQCIVWTKV